jgi:hypothetical protein
LNCSSNSLSNCIGSGFCVVDRSLKSDARLVVDELFAVALAGEKVTSRYAQLLNSIKLLSDEEPAKPLFAMNEENEAVELFKLLRDWSTRLTALSATLVTVSTRFKEVLVELEEGVELDAFDVEADDVNADGRRKSLNVRFVSFLDENLFKLECSFHI